MLENEKINMKDFLQLLKNIFSNNSEPSLKRICGFMGWVLGIWVIIYCTLYSIPAQGIVLDFLMLSTALLGLDTVMNIFNKKISNKNNLKKEKENEN